ncbi:MAG: hypothetical protein MJY91_05530 [Bacteroidales bacterium]|nr:hypothetical protein [Candidatus Cryptobacteroides choladohippi]MCQ2179542.1 hypothetical protein [Bacteroidales bacterium]
MNLRDIKKDIDYVLSAFLEDCAVVATINSKASVEEVEKLYEEAVDLYNELRDKAAAKYESGAKAHFNGLRKEILERTNDLYIKLSDAVKKANA